MNKLKLLSLTKNIRVFTIILIIHFFVMENVSPKERYINNEVGFSLIVPSGVLQDRNLSWKDKKDNKYYINVLATAFDELEKDKNNFYYIKKELGYDIKEDLKVNGFFEYFKNNDYVLLSSSSGLYKKYFFRKDIIGEAAMCFPYPGSTAFYSITILYNDMIITIQLSYVDFKRSIPLRYPEYFNGEFAEGTYWCDLKDKESRIAFYKLIETKDKKAPIELLKLQEYFNEIVSSLQFFEPTMKTTKLLTPTIDNLRFRESPTLDGKFIRLLVKGEKLEVVERGKTEEVSGTKGTWVKVKTEKNEVGWCFDAFLEEMK